MQAVHLQDNAAGTAVSCDSFQHRHHHRSQHTSMHLHSAKSPKQLSAQSEGACWLQCHAEPEGSHCRLQRPPHARRQRHQAQCSTGGVPGCLSPVAPNSCALCSAISNPCLARDCRLVSDCCLGVCLLGLIPVCPCAVCVCLYKIPLSAACMATGLSASLMTRQDPLMQTVQLPCMLHSTVCYKGIYDHHWRTGDTKKMRAVLVMSGLGFQTSQMWFYMHLVRARLRSISESVH